MRFDIILLEVIALDSFFFDISIASYLAFLFFTHCFSIIHILVRYSSFFDLSNFSYFVFLFCNIFCFFSWAIVLYFICFVCTDCFLHKIY